MSKDTKFTPGPWQVDREGGGAAQQWIVTDLERFNDHNFRNIAVAIHPAQRGELSANAHLIAAAPEMYAALERGVRYFVDANVDREAWMQMVDDWRRLLAKARGEAQP